MIIIDNFLINNIILSIAKSYNVLYCAWDYYVLKNKKIIYHSYTYTDCFNFIKKKYKF